jgi:hypothetical protein
MKTIKEVLDFVGLKGKESTIAANLKLWDKKLNLRFIKYPIKGEHTVCFFYKL